MIELPKEWLPTASMARIIVHWTAGGYVASSLDKEHYHFLVEGDLDVVKGLHSVKDNEVIRGEGKYAAHTLSCNTKSIGVSMCCMARAVEAPFSAGVAPMREGQWKKVAELVAVLCVKYGIPVTNKTVLTHAEVQPNLGITQRGKWDVARLPFNPALVGAKACGDDLRRNVTKYLQELKAT